MDQQKKIEIRRLAGEIATATHTKDDEAASVRYMLETTLRLHALLSDEGVDDE